MKSLLTKLFDKSALEAVDEILSTYHQESFAVVNFIYFSDIVAQMLFEDKYKTEK